MAKPTIRTLWGLAKCQELSLTDEELHLIVSANTGKDSIKQLNQRELGTVIGVLCNMKSSASKNSRSDRQSRGSTGTVNQRKKIYKLTETLGWDKPARVNGLCKKMFGVACVEWLNYQQCSKLIEALKSMAGRMEKEDTVGSKRDNQGNG
ncbi:MAG: regulatory protein GemA [Roseburia sp.]|nr:regulatory protein GemA [Roseburia sp.]